MYNSMFTHEVLLSDKIRNKAYQRAIRKYVRDSHVVIDIGTGSGILSFLAARAGARRVYAVEELDIITIARSVAKHNNLRNITFIQSDIYEAKLPEKANIIVHEQIGNILLDEGLIDKLMYTRDTWLMPGGRILPNSFELFVEPVKLKDEHRVPFIWEQDIQGITFSTLKKHKAKTHYLRYVDRSKIDRLLTQPKPAFHLNIETLKKRDIPKDIHIKRHITRGGRCDGFCVYFKACFDTHISFSNLPKSDRTHWPVGLLRLEARHYKKGELITFKTTLKKLIDAARNPLY